jgi:hypothetical protein
LAAGTHASEDLQTIYDEEGVDALEFSILAKDADQGEQVQPLAVVA